ncbi:MAG: hypothetical protein LBJ75_02475 [Puniceicoccales bacterium]|jgi:hypothetical protein|nr:hypothetical protein [Puniceicoccales bacterium]
MTTSSKENNKAIIDDKGEMFSAALKQLEGASPKLVENGTYRAIESPMINLQTTILDGKFLEKISQDFLYVSNEKSFYERLSDGSYAAIKDDHLGSKLKQRFGLSSHSQNHTLLSPVKQAMMYIQENRRCEGTFQSLAGYLAGIHAIGSLKILVKNNLSLMNPEKRPFDTLMALFSHVFGNDEPYYQLDRFLTWLQHAYLGAYEIYVKGKNVGKVSSTGLALILCGKSQVGKTYIAGLITKIFGGVLGQPFRSMTGKTEFNSDCAKAIHLSIDDQTGTRTYEQRKEHGQNLKAMLSGSAQWIQAKHVDAFTAPLYQRITYSFNSDRDSFSTFPALSDGVRERILALKTNSEKWICFQRANTMEERIALDCTIVHELPGLLYHLKNDYIPPKSCVNSSFGCKEFIHPDIERQVEMGTPESTFKDLILDYLQSSNYIGYHTADSCNFSGNASVLMEGMLASPAHREGVRTLAKNVVSFGMRLSELCTVYPKHFRKNGTRENNRQCYSISIAGFQPLQGQFENIKTTMFAKGQQG